MKSRWSVFSALICFVFLTGLAGGRVGAATVSSNVPAGQLLWTNKLPAALVGSPALNAESTTLYVGAANRRFYALDTESGDTNWILRLPAAPTSSPVIDDDGLIYIGCANGVLYRIREDEDGVPHINEREGDSPPFHPFLGGRISTPAIDDDGTVYAGSTANHLYALRPDGSKQWVYNATNNVMTPVIGGAGVFIVSGGYVRGVGIDDGAEISSFTPRSLIHSIPALAEDGTLYFGANDERVYALNSGGTASDWRFNTRKDVMSSPAVGTDGRIYIASDSSFLYCLNINGVVVWKKATAAPIRSALSIGADGTIYAGCDDRRLYAFSPDDGRILWTVKTRAPIRSSAVIDSMGAVYFSSGRTVYAVSNNVTEDIGEPAWQMFRKDRRHTARATVNIAATNAPVIVQNPTSRTAVTNTAVTFTVTADGARPLFYQWRFNLNAIDPASNTDATNATLALANVTIADQGFYDVIVTNAFGRATSAPPAQLTVTTNSISATNAVVITQQPANLIVGEGTSATFSITATGAPAPSFQWYFSTNAISSASNPTAITTNLLLINVQGANAGFYYAVAANAAGSVTSVTASLTVTNMDTVWLPNNTNGSGMPLSNSPPFITQQPTNRAALTNTTASFTVIAFGAVPLFYQWYDGTNLIDVAGNATATNATLTFANVSATNTGIYRVVVSNSLGSVTSVTAGLLVTNSPFGSVVGPASDQKSISIESDEMRIGSVAVNGDGVAIEVSGRSDRRKLVLEYTDALSAPEWKPLSTNDSGQLKLIDPMPPLNRSRYYRVRAE